MNKELDVVALTRDQPQCGLVAGDVGTVVMMHDGGTAFEVELVGLDGSTIALLTLASEDLRPVAPREVAHARKVA